MKAPLLFAALIVSVAVSAVYSLTLLDNIVHGTLYNYGLQFSYDWATPYYTILRTIQALMGLSAVFALSFTIYVYKKYVHAKPQIEPQSVREEQVFSSATETQIEPIVREESVSPSTTEPQIKPIVHDEVVSVSATELQIEPIVREESVSSSATEPQPRSVSELVICAYCGKTFSQPLRKLDFLADKPRIVSVCPFCNEEIKLAIRPRELVRVEKAVQKKKRKRKAKVMRKSKEAIQEQPKEEAKDIVTVQAC
jgi:hypothetical protein